MSCRRAVEMMDPYLDGELDILPAAEIERHIEQCKDCNAYYLSQIKLRSTLRDPSLYYRAPRNLRERIRSSLPTKSRTNTANKRN